MRLALRSIAPQLVCQKREALDETRRPVSRRRFIERIDEELGRLDVVGYLDEYGTP